MDQTRFTKITCNCTHMGEIYIQEDTHGDEHKYRHVSAGTGEAIPRLSFCPPVLGSFVDHHKKNIQTSLTSNRDYFKYFKRQRHATERGKIVFHQTRS